LLGLNGGFGNQSLRCAETPSSMARRA
jgi:hypothetical protein